MKPYLLYALVAFLPGSMLAADQIQVEAKFIAGTSRYALVHDLKKLTLPRGPGRGTDIISPSPATATSGKRIEFTIEPVPPAQWEHDRWALAITPRTVRGGIAFTAHLTHRSAREAGHAQQPGITAYSTSELHASGTHQAGEELWLDLPAADGKPRAVRIVFTPKRA